MRATINDEYPAANVPLTATGQPSALGVGRWRLDGFALILSASLVTGFAVHLSADEPALSPANAAAPAANTAEPAPVAHRERAFAESDLLQLLAATLQQDYVKDRGELELRLAQPWKTRNVPDELLTLKVLDLPTLGVTPMFVVRLDLRTAHGSLGVWQLPVQAHVWREVWVARSALQRGEFISDADITRERRDVLTVHEPLAEFAAGDTSLLLAESLQTGSLLLARSVKVRPVIHRGQTADALVQDGALSITLKVEVLEDGVSGQVVRVRNVQSRRDIRGKVLNEKTILVSL
jgi:flagella basal body P-ring formation protein FlgA